MSKRRRRFRGWSPSNTSDAESGDSTSRPAIRLVPIAAAGALLLVVALVAVFGFRALQPDAGPAGPPRAVIVDQLSLSYPNPAFVDEATATLEKAGYVVDYIPGEDVTISLYYHLPEMGYEYVLLRTHQAVFNHEWRGRKYNEPVLFTAEPYDPTLFPQEQWDLELVPAYMIDGAPRYFGVTANFIESRMQGDFGDATVIMMGCSGLGSDRTAEAFINRGAGAVVGWTDLVSSSHTDRATQRFLDKVLLEDQTVEAAVAQTMAEIGPDPAYDSVLNSYPPRYPSGG